VLEFIANHQLAAWVIFAAVFIGCQVAEATREKA
jgi:hypothetical protein